MNPRSNCRLARGRATQRAVGLLDLTLSAETADPEPGWLSRSERAALLCASRVTGLARPVRGQDNRVKKPRLMWYPLKAGVPCMAFAGKHGTSAL
jgi:hypothetical protein